jgi:hypothetical protein
MAPSYHLLWHDLRRQGRLVGRAARQASAAVSGSSGRERQEALKGLFGAVNTWLRGASVDYWVVYGTLLGWYREGAILSHDGDVDFGVPEECYDVLKGRSRMLPPGFQLFDTSRRHGGPKLYVSHRGWEADIYFFRRTGDRLTTILRSAIPSDTLPFPVSWFYPPAPATFLGAATQVPNSPELYLRHLYGYLGPDGIRDRATGLYRPRSESRMGRGSVATDLR